MTFGCELATNNHWVMSEPLNDIKCELAINNHWFMAEPLKDIWV